VESVTAENLRAFLERLGEEYSGPVTLYLLGGGALCLLGNPRVTVDLDYWYAVSSEEEARFKATVEKLAGEMHLDVEDVPLDEFVPLPAGAYARRQLVGRFGGVEAYIFDPYTIALSKIARGFETDLDDVLFMIDEGMIEFAELECLFDEVLPRSAEADIIPQEFQEYFEELRLRVEKSSR
jgi:hypothetical protein